ncbi:MAG TPA: hypothetical protein PK509_01110 [Catalimonadaceae bacterium]|nr:hypothetical protein [Catalimonadaceae bacterium]HPI10407.1 hypothetical protein [Catalimonadaceae bacterium]
MAEQQISTEEPISIRLGQVWGEIPPVAKVMLIGLTFISGVVVWSFIQLVLQPGPLVAGEDLYIHIALLFLVPGSMIGLYLISFGYSYYQICKRLKRKPFWKSFLDDQ